MARKRKKVLQVGDRFQTYISSAAHEDLLSFINKQSDLSSTVLYGFLVLHAKYGDRDITEFIPRTFNPESFEEDFINKFLGGSKQFIERMPTVEKPKIEPQIATQAQPQAEPQTATQAQPQAEPQTATQAQPQAEPQAETQAQQQAEPQAETPTPQTPSNMGMGNLFQIGQQFTHGQNKKS